MSQLNGQQRVIIENVQPEVGNGMYPAKRTVGESVEVTADIFCDGHDHLRAHLLYRKEPDEQWQTIEMSHRANDVWSASFPVMEKGYYDFTVLAWIDHFDTWYDGFKKKANANVDVSVELLEGIQFLKKLSDGKDAQLDEAAKKLKKKYDTAVEYVLSEPFAKIVHHYPLIEHAVMPEKQWRVVVEHKKANFSAWYELFPRSASPTGEHGTFRDVIRLLPRISAMGFDVLYLPPIHPIG